LFIDILYDHIFHLNARGHPNETRKEWLLRLFQFFANRYQHDSEHHFWQFGNQPVDLEKFVKKDQPIPSPLDSLMKEKIVDIPEHYVYCSAYPSQKVKLFQPDPDPPSAVTKN